MVRLSAAPSAVHHPFFSQIGVRYARAASALLELRLAVWAGANTLQHDATTPKQNPTSTQKDRWQI
jgi:hypothetical protein